MLPCMRSGLAVLMMLALVLVTSLPLIPVSEACAMGDAGMQHAIAVTSDSHADEQPSPAPEHCCIECGCGCHASIDALPHQLAPHALDSGSPVREVAWLVPAPAADNPPIKLPLRIPVPPPESLIS